MTIIVNIDSSINHFLAIFDALSSKIKIA